MEQNKKECPYCGEEINVDANKCKFCGEWLEEKKSSSKAIRCPYCLEEVKEDLDICPCCGEKLIKKKKTFDTLFKILKFSCILSTILIVLFLSYDLFQNRFQVNDIEYKSISNVESSDWFGSHLSVKEMLELVVRQEADLNEYIKSNHSKKENTGVFKLYYKNLQFLTEALNDYNKIELYYSDTSNKANNAISNILEEYGVTPMAVYTDSNRDDIADYFKIINPFTETIEIIYEGEGYHGFHINDTYIADSYADYLNQDWRDYMHNKKLVYDDLNHCNYFDDGYIIPDGITLAKWAIIWEKFLKSYPKFELKDKVVKDFENYSNDMWYAKEPYEYNEKAKKSTLRKDIKEGYEYFLQNANKNTKEYKKIKKNYEILQKNNFEDNEETEKIYTSSNE